MESLPHPADGRLVGDVDRRDSHRFWVFLHGFGGERGGAKGTAFRAAAARAGASFAAFDFRGHGASSGSIEDLTLSGWLEDVDLVTQAVVPGNAQLVLVGSSLGGLAATWWARLHPGRVRANVLVAPAFGFLPRFLAEMGPERAAAWARDGVLRYTNEWLDVPLKHGLVTDAARYDEAALAADYRTDTVIVHGLKDERVPWQAATAFVERCPHRPIDVLLLGDGNHRLEGRVEDAARFASQALDAWGLGA